MSEEPAEIEVPRIEEPFPGLRPFLRHESEIFYGRGEQVDQMLARLEDHHFLAVVGSSGSGKSSLVRAGLLPALEEGFLSGSSSDWLMVTMRPGGDPFRRLAEKLDQAAAGCDLDAGTGAQVAFIEATLRSGPKGLLHAIRDRQIPAETTILLLVDQFEEIFRFRMRDQLGRSESAVKRRNDSTAFVNLLLATVRKMDRPIYVVLTMRSDFIGDCDSFHGLPEAVSSGQFLTPRPTRAQMEDTIRGPLDVFGWSAEDAMVTAVLNDTGNELDQLPLMQHALMRTWHRALHRPESAEEKVVTLDDYRAVGGLHEALSRHAEEAWDNLENDRQRWITQVLFRCLSERTEESPLTRRIASAGEVAGVAGGSVDEIAAVVKIFQRDHRNFLVVNPPGDVKNSSFLDISHEALMRQWDRFGRWLDAETSSADMYLSVVRTARRWKQGDASLWRPPELKNAVDWLENEKPTEIWAQRYDSDFQLGMEFIESSRVEHQAKLDAEERLRRRGKLQRIVWLFIVPVTVLAVVASLGWHKARIARDQANLANGLASARLLALHATQTVQRDPELAILLAMEAAIDAKELDPESLPREIEGALRTGVASSSIRKRYVSDMDPSVVVDFENPVVSIDFHPDGKHLVTAKRVLGDDSENRGSVQIRNIETDGLVWREEEWGRGRLSCVRFNHDGTRLVTTSYVEGENTGDAILWNSENLGKLERQLVLEGHSSGIVSAAFDPLGRYVATGGRDKEICLHDVVTGKLIKRIPVRGDEGAAAVEVTSLAFGPGGGTLLATSKDGTAFVLDLDSEGDPVILDGAAGRAHFERLKHSREEVHAGDFSPDGKLVATVGNDYNVRVWEAETGRLLELYRHDDSVLDVEFIDDSRLATACNDSAVRIWKLESIPKAVFNRDEPGKSVESSGPSEVNSPKPADETGAKPDPVKIILIREIEESILRGNRSWVYGLSVSQDGRYLATAGKDGTARVWDLSSRKELSVLSGFGVDYWCGGILIDRNKKPMAYGGTTDGNLLRWDAWLGDRYDALGPELPLPSDFKHTGQIRAIGVSQKRFKLVTASNDGSAIVWNAETGRSEARLLGEEETGTVYHARFSRGGDRIVTASRDGIARIWAEEDGGWKQVQEFKVDPAPGTPKPRIFDARFSWDGELIVTADFDLNTATIWNASSGEKIRVLGGAHVGIVLSAAFSPDRRHVATASTDGHCRIWDAETGELVGEPLFHGATPRSAEYSPDGKLLLTATSDGLAKLWSVNNHYRLRSVLTGHVGSITDVAFSHEEKGAYIITSCRDGTSRIFLADPWAVYYLAEQRITRKLDPDERADYGVSRDLGEHERKYYKKSRKPEESADP